MIRIELLTSADVDAIAGIVSEPDDTEGRFFDGLPVEPEALRVLLESADQDCYWALWIGSRLGGLFMLRGFDAGYSTPSFGVVIAREFRGAGLGRLALQYAEVWCRLRKTEGLMLTVSEQNSRAIALYERCGFERTGERSPKGNLIYRKRLNR
jgi:RimJ/RimL family protein N-acetyltransferase